MDQPVPKSLIHRLCLCVVFIPALSLYWHLFPNKQTITIPVDTITKGKGYTYQWKIPNPGHLVSYRSDTSQHPTASTLSLLENGAPLTQPHSPHKTISNLGRGRFSHWGDTLYFSTSDNSPLPNKDREYRIEVEAIPGQMVTYISILAGLFWLVALSFTGNGIRKLLIICTLLAGISAIVATLTRVYPLRYELTFSHEQASKEENFTSFSDYTLYRYTFEPLVAPFLELNFTPPVSTEHLLLRFENGSALTAVLNDEIHPYVWEPPKNFVLDSRSIVYGIPTIPYEFSGPKIILNSPLSTTKGGVLLLWFTVALLLIALLSQSKCKSPVSRLCMLGVSNFLTLGGVLLACSLMGISLSLNEDDLKFLRGTPFGSHDRTLTWEETKTSLKTLSAIPEESERIAQISRVVAGRILHNWNYIDKDALHMQFPLWKNWVLWLFGEISPKYRRYIIADLPTSLERGVGHCGQASLVLAKLLRSYGTTASIVGLNGHTIVSAIGKNGEEFILDPDFGVTFAGTYQEYITEPGLTDRYSKALKDLGMREEIQPFVLRMVLAIFKRSNPTHSSPEQFHGNTAFEEGSYYYKWLLPSAGILAGLLFLFLATKYNRRTTVPNSPVPALERG